MVGKRIQLATKNYLKNQFSRYDADTYPKLERNSAKPHSLTIFPRYSNQNLDLIDSAIFSPSWVDEKPKRSLKVDQKTSLQGCVLCAKPLEEFS